MIDRVHMSSSIKLKLLLIYDHYVILQCYFGFYFDWIKWIEMLL